MDIITTFAENYVDWCNNLDGASYSFIVKAGLLLLLPMALTKVAIAQKVTSKTALLGLVIAGVFAAAIWPVPEPSPNPTLNSALITVSIFIVLSFPAILPKDVTDKLTVEKRTVWILYAVFLLLFLMQILGAN